jgi:hypothetical protein
MPAWARDVYGVRVTRKIPAEAEIVETVEAVDVGLQVAVGVVQEKLF